VKSKYDILESLYTLTDTDEYFTDGIVLVKGDKPKHAKLNGIEGKLPLDRFSCLGVKAKLVYLFQLLNDGDVSVSYGKNLADLRQGTYYSGSPVLAMFYDEDGNLFTAIKNGKLQVILKYWHDVDFEITGNGIRVKKGEEVVGLVATYLRYRENSLPPELGNFIAEIEERKDKLQSFVSLGGGICENIR